MTEIVKYVPFQSTAEPSFWMKLGEHKLNTLKLNENTIPITASYDIVPSVTHRGDGSNSSADPIPGRMRFDQDSIPDDDDDDVDTKGTDSTINQIDSPNLPLLYNEKIFTTGKMLILNTIESFKTADKNELLNRHCLVDLLKVCGVRNADGSTVEGTEEGGEENLDVLATFFCLCHLDLKSHKVVYWFAFPVLVPAPGKSIRYMSSSTSQKLLREAWGNEKCKRLIRAVQTLRRSLLLGKDSGDKQKGCPSFFMVIESATSDGSEDTNSKLLKCIELTARAYTELSSDDKKCCSFAFIDPTTTNAQNDEKEPVGWALRNLIAYITLKLNLAGEEVNIISYKPSLLRRVNSDSSPSDDLINDNDIINDSSLLLKVQLPHKDDFLWQNKKNPDEKPHYTCMGWELNTRARPGPRSVNLAPLLSPAHLAQQATDLNLKLMKWRMIPNLDLGLLGRTRVVLLGAGTLGCSVARTLLGWGVRHFQFVDNGKVSYSNPVRQNLFELKDCEQGGVDKAIAAAAALKKIAGPTIESEGHVLTIPMPGHKIEQKEEEKVRKDVEKMHQLIDEADVVFLLTDTRESRWLPTVMARASDKMMINAALGLDSWLVMRHGGNKDGRLGCYFCNDIVAPENSTNNRTLDQQCTVTRPGLAPIASSMAVELMVALLHHKEKQNAPAPKPTSGVSSFSPTVDSSSTETSPLGIMPHQIRGSIVSYTMMTPTVPNFRCCTACSDPVIEAYKKDFFDFVKKVCCDDGTYLEDVSELTAFRDEAALKMEDCLDWEEDSQEEGNDTGEDDF